jgi:hypothetical protein
MKSAQQEIRARSKYESSFYAVDCAYIARLRNASLSTAHDARRCSGVRAERHHVICFQPDADFLADRMVVMAGYER